MATFFENLELVGAAAFDFLDPSNQVNFLLTGEANTPRVAAVLSEQFAEQGVTLRPLTEDERKKLARNGMDKVVKAAGDTVETIATEIKNDVGAAFDGAAFVAKHWKPILIGVAALAAIGALVVYGPPVVKAAKAVLPA